ncbi:MAG: hypothetical protein ACXVJX_01660 [Acidimicrobiia bacterium]
MPEWVRILIALAACVGIYLIGVRMVRVMLMPPPPDEPDVSRLEPVDLHYRCTVCGTEVTRTAAPDAEADAPRHCREDMQLLGTSESAERP